MRVFASNLLRDLGVVVLVVTALACGEPAPSPTDPLSSQFAKGGGSGGPSVTSAIPSESTRDTTLNVTVNGSGFDAGSQVAFLLAGTPDAKVRTNATSYISSSQLVASITIDADAAVAYRDVQVTTGGGKKGIGTEKFEVLAIGPGAGRAVGGDGTIFVTVFDDSPSGVAAWSSPVGPVTLIDVYGSAWYSAANTHGDVAGFRRETGIEAGAWLKTGAATWTYSQSPAPGAADYSVNAINDAREMAGFVRYVGGNYQAAYFAGPGEPPVVLPAVPGSSSDMAEGINNAGDLVGRATLSGISVPVLWRRTSSTTWTAQYLPRPNPSQSGNAYIINDAGQVMGSNGATYRWTPSGTGWTVTLVGSSSVRPSMDACGRVVGGASAARGQPERGWVWDGALTYLPAPAGSSGAVATAISRTPVSGQQIITGRMTKRGKTYPTTWTIPGCP